jgi:hypothetical protein
MAYVGCGARSASQWPQPGIALFWSSFFQTCCALNLTRLQLLVRSFTTNFAVHFFYVDGAPASLHNAFGFEHAHQLSWLPLLNCQVLFLAANLSCTQQHTFVGPRPIHGMRRGTEIPYSWSLFKNKACTFPLNTKHFSFLTNMHVTSICSNNSAHFLGTP